MYRALERESAFAGGKGGSMSAGSGGGGRGGGSASGGGGSLNMLKALVSESDVLEGAMEMFD